MFVPAFLTHACLGAAYGWSAITQALTREQGQQQIINEEKKLVSYV